VKAIYQQTVSAKNTSKAIRQKKAWSYKAQMNGAIHALLGYQYEVFLYINGQQEKLPIRPEKSTDIFQLSLKYIDFNSAQKVYDMLCFLQIQRARLESYAPNSQTDEYQYNYAFTDIIFLYHMLLDMLEYARDEANEIPNNIATPEKMEKATRSLLTNKAGKCFMADLGKHLVIAHQKFDKNNHFLKRNRATFFE
jgi:hypothetical protein